MTPHRDRLQEDLKRHGIPTAVHYPVPLHKQPAYTRHASRSLAISESVAEQVISLPMYADLSAEILHAIAVAVGQVPSMHSVV
jgi:dTDP-4-amino-4,6-dideoxygalactose transaminase